MFIISKLLSSLTQPLFWLCVWCLIALVLLPRFRRMASSMLWCGLFIFVTLGFNAIPDSLLRSLETQFNVPSVTQSDQYVGLIVLGGATGNPAIYKTYDQVPLGEAAERMTVPIALMRKFPDFELIFSGGEGRLVPSGTTEAELARVFFTDMGVDMNRVTLESASRTTRENAEFVSELLGERCKKPWLLVTSASHMRRSMAEFQSVGCNVTAYSVDFRTGEETSWTEYSIVGSLKTWQTVLHELLGMVVYKVTR
jgi:uncharacterized SAM-binding protein YcdF (DUF218 family)